MEDLKVERKNLFFDVLDNLKKSIEHRIQSYVGERDRGPLI